MCCFPPLPSPPLFGGERLVRFLCRKVVNGHRSSMYDPLVSGVVDAARRRFVVVVVVNGCSFIYAFFPTRLLLDIAEKHSTLPSTGYLAVITPHQHTNHKSPSPTSLPHPLPPHRPYQPNF